MLLKHVVLHDKNKMNLLYNLNLNVKQQYHWNILIQKLNRLLFHPQNVRSFSFEYFLSLIILIYLDNVEIRHDEYPRKGMSIDALSRLNTVFKEGKNSNVKNKPIFILFLAGTVTAGNASGFFLFLSLFDLCFIF